MSNVLLGKTLKAMYKLSGKTLMQLSDETGLTVDTINNLFYARVQKPGLLGVSALVKAMGFSVQELMSFMEEKGSEISESTDVVELFTSYIFSAEDAIKPVIPTKEQIKSVDITKAQAPCAYQLEQLNAQHEKQLDRYRSIHNHYVEQMQQHFDRSVADLKAAHEAEIRTLKRANMLLAVALAAGILLLIAVAVFGL